MLLRIVLVSCDGHKTSPLLHFSIVYIFLFFFVITELISDVFNILTRVTDKAYLAKTS